MTRSQSDVLNSKGPIQNIYKSLALILVPSSITQFRIVLSDVYCLTLMKFLSAPFQQEKTGSPFTLTCKSSSSCKMVPSYLPFIISCLFTYHYKDAQPIADKLITQLRSLLPVVRSYWRMSTLLNGIFLSWIDGQK